MAKKGRYQLMKFSGYVGIYDTKEKKRLENLTPTKRVTVKNRPATPYGAKTETRYGLVMTGRYANLKGKHQNTVMKRMEKANLFKM